MTLLREYDREWLDSVKLTEGLIKTMPLDDIPIQYRSLIRQQFDVQVKYFYADLAAARDPRDAQSAILDLALLIQELIKNDKGHRGVHAA